MNGVLPVVRRCPDCGSPLVEGECRGSDCSEPLHDGVAVCPRCGTPYVPVPDTAADLTPAWAEAQRALIRDLRELTGSGASSI